MFPKELKLFLYIFRIGFVSQLLQFFGGFFYFVIFYFAMYLNRMYTCTHTPFMLLFPRLRVPQSILTYDYRRSGCTLKN